MVFIVQFVHMNIQESTLFDEQGKSIFALIFQLVSLIMLCAGETSDHRAYCCSKEACSVSVCSVLFIFSCVNVKVNAYD